MRARLVVSYFDLRSGRPALTILFASWVALMARIDPVRLPFAIKLVPFDLLAAVIAASAVSILSSPITRDVEWHSIRRVTLWSAAIHLGLSLGTLIILWLVDASAHYPLVASIVFAGVSTLGVYVAGRFSPRAGGLAASAAGLIWIYGIAASEIDVVRLAQATGSRPLMALELICVLMAAAFIARGGHRPRRPGRQSVP